jgi:hypothetical protein
MLGRRITKDLEGSDICPIEILFRHFPEGTEEYDDNPHSGQPVSRLRTENGYEIWHMECKRS